LLFMVMAPAAPLLISLGGHSEALQRLEMAYLYCLSFAALPMLVMAAINGFFSGRGKTGTVLGIEAFGTGVNVALALCLIFGRAGFPEMGIEGAGWATVAGSWASALLALGFFLRRQYRTEFATGSGWRFERDLFGRLLRYGGPAGMQVFLDVLVFHLFTQIVGKLGDVAMGATTLTVRLNMIAFLPMIGLGQAVSIVVGQRLGANRPDLAEKSTYIGLRWMLGYMGIVAVIYLECPRELRRAGGGGAVPADLRGDLFSGRFDQSDILVRPAGRGRYLVRFAPHVLPRLAADGGADLLRLAVASRRHLGMGVRDDSYHRDVGVLFLSLPVGKMEDDAGD
jgi:MATE family multidrug resistance protein